MIDLLARTALVTPDLTAEPRIVQIWTLTQAIANSAYVLLVVVGVGDWWWRTTQAVAPQPAAAITATTPPAPGTGAPGRDSLVASVISDQTASVT